MTDEDALQQLAERARLDSTTTAIPTFPKPVDEPIYDFEHLGLRIAESLVLAAEAQVAEASDLLAQTQALADSIREQVRIQTNALASLNGRLKVFGVQMLEAHRKFNGNH